MGLGLAICKSIVEGHHGELTVSSGINDGARFQVTIPIEPVTEAGGQADIDFRSVISYGNSLVDHQADRVPL